MLSHRSCDPEFLGNKTITSATSNIFLDLRGHDADGKSEPNIFSQMVVQNGDECNGIKLKDQQTKTNPKLYGDYETSHKDPIGSNFFPTTMGINQGQW